MSEWDAAAHGWDDDPVVRRYAGEAVRSLTDRLTSLGVTLDGAVFCDFGCGTGLLTEQVVGPVGRVDAIDTSPAMLGVLRSKVDAMGWSHVRLLTELPTEPQGYDVIACSSVLSFVDDYPATVGRLAGHLSPGGLLIHWDWELDRTDTDPHGLVRDEVHTALERAGLVDVEVATAFDIDVEGTTMRPIVGSGRRTG